MRKLGLSPLLGQKVAVEADVFGKLHLDYHQEAGVHSFEAYSGFYENRIWHALGHHNHREACHRRDVPSDAASDVHPLIQRIRLEPSESLDTNV